MFGVYDDGVEDSVDWFAERLEIDLEFLFDVEFNVSDDIVDGSLD